MRRAVAPTLVLLTVLAVLAPPAGAASTDTVVSPGTNATYQRVLTCATNSLTVRADYQRSNSGAGVDLAVTGRDGLGAFVDRVVFPLRSPLTSRWVSSPSVATYTTEDAGVVSNMAPLGPPISTLDCPDYLDSAGLVFQQNPAVRVLDTRPSSRVEYSGDKPGAGALVPVNWRRAFPMVADGIEAVVLNLTATEATAPGFVQAVPVGLATPGSSSNLNVERAGQTIANLAVVPVGAGGAISLFTQRGTHLVADVVGAFRRPFGPTAPSGRYTGLDNPVRVLDTRPGSRVGWSGDKPGPGASVPFRLDVDGLPPRAEIGAAVLNVTVTEATGPGFVTVYPADIPRPGTSNLNVDLPGQTIPNLVIVPVAATGEFAAQVFTQSGGHLLVDVIGVLSSEAALPYDGGVFVPMTPERVLDTRLASAVNWDSDAAIASFGVAVPGTGTKPAAGEKVTVFFDGLPGDAAAAIVNLTGTEASLPGFVQAAAASTLVPGASSNLNLVAGQTVPNAVVVPLDEQVAAGFFTSGGTHLVVDVSGFFTF